MAETETKRKKIGRPKGSKNKRIQRSKPEEYAIPQPHEPISEPQPAASTLTAYADATQAPAQDHTKPEAQAQPGSKEPPAPSLRKVNLPPPAPTFFQRMNAIPKADWGTRTHIYLYRLEPFLDRTQSGLPKYITKYGETISEERVLNDHGSGKYKAVLNYCKPAAERGDEIDSTFFELLNLKFPPRIPPVGLETRTPGDGDWVDDPRNRKWAWAKNFFPSGKPAPASQSLLQDLEVLDRITNRHNNGNQQRDATEQLATVVTVAKDLAALQKPPESPAGMVLEYMKFAGAANAAQLTAAQAEIAASRERSDKLMTMLLDAIKAGADKRPAEVNTLGSVKDLLAAVKDFLPTIKEIIPEAAAAGARSRMSGWQEFTAAVLPHAAEILKPFSAIIAQSLIAQAMRPPAANGAHPPAGATPAPGPQLAGLPPGAQPPAGTPPPAPGGSVPAFLNMIVNPLLNYVRVMAPPHNVDPAEIGREFAEWVHEGYSADPRYEEALASIKMLGAPGITAALKSTAWWTDKGPAGMRPSLAELEAPFQTFMAAFLDWKPDETEGAEDKETDEDGVVKFDELYARG